MKSRITIKFHNIFTIIFISSYGRSLSDILLFTSITCPQQIFCGKLLRVLNCDHHLKLCMKKKKKKPAKEDWVEQWILAHPIWLNPKKVWEYNKMLQYLHNIYF